VDSSSGGHPPQCAWIRSATFEEPVIGGRDQSTAPISLGAQVATEVDKGRSECTSREDSGLGRPVLILATANQGKRRGMACAAFDRLRGWRWRFSSVLTQLNARGGENSRVVLARADAWSPRGGGGWGFRWRMSELDQFWQDVRTPQVVVLKKMKPSRRRQRPGRAAQAMQFARSRCLRLTLPRLKPDPQPRLDAKLIAGLPAHEGS